MGLALFCWFLALFLFYVVGALCSLVLVSTFYLGLLRVLRQFNIFLLVSLDSSLCLLLMQLVLYFDQ